MTRILKLVFSVDFSMLLKVFRIFSICLFWRFVRATYGLYPEGLNIRMKPFIEFEASDLKVFWKETIKKTEENLLEALCIRICEILFTIEEKFWVELRYLEKEQESEDLKE